MEGMNWRKSSYSGNSGGNCTEVATIPGAVLVRDSKDPRSPALVFRPRTWAAFTAALRADNVVPGRA
jgi:Domain of unknown function (DUF397)